jgi:hypothetical protein
LVGREMLYREPWTPDAAVPLEDIVLSSQINRSKLPMLVYRSRRLQRMLMDVSNKYYVAEYVQLLRWYAFQGSPPSQEVLPYIELDQSIKMTL